MKEMVAGWFECNAQLRLVEVFSDNEGWLVRREMMEVEHRSRDCLDEEDEWLMYMDDRYLPL